MLFLKLALATAIGALYFCSMLFACRFVDFNRYPEDEDAPHTS